MLRLRSALTALAALAVLGTAACDLSTESTATDVEPRDLVYAPALGVDFDDMQVTPQGLYWQDIGVPGDGEIVQVFVENGQPVQYGERLFAVRAR